ncbi:hypothetical protein GGF50DRAFT_124849 [Schizophyllum commune]
MSNSAATRVAETYELAFRIFKHAQHDGGNVALLTVALVNHFVGSIALDVLWQEQTSLLPLIKVLGDRLESTIEKRHGCVTVDENTSRLTVEEHQVLFLKPNDEKKVSIALEEWQRLQFYARRIKVLDDKPLVQGESFDIHLWLGSLCAILAGGGSDPLLPNLHHLNFGQRMESLCDSAKLSARYVDESGERVPYLGLIAYTPRQPRGAWVPGNLCRLEQIRSLGIEPDKHLAIYPLLRDLRYLEELHIKLPDAENDEDLILGVTGKKAAVALGFPALTKLRISDPIQMHSVGTVLRKMSTEPLKLKELHVTGWRHDFTDETDAISLYSDIGDACDHNTLTHLTTITHSGSSQFQSAFELYSDLLVFPNITHFQLNIFAWHLDVEGALDMFTQAWPQLESLILLNRPAYATDTLEREFTLLTLSDLEYLARRCPRLSYVELEMDLQEVPYPLENLEGEPLLDRRVKLCLGPQDNLHENLSDDYTRDVADYLASVFPYPTLECVTYREGDTSYVWLTPDDLYPKRVRGEAGADTQSAKKKKGKKGKKGKKPKADTSQLQTFAATVETSATAEDTAHGAADVEAPEPVAPAKKTGKKKKSKGKKKPSATPPATDA